jgi:hypothetical protein
MVAKCAMGLTCANGWIQPGIASMGVRAPDSIASGGFTKKLMS